MKRAILIAASLLMYASASAQITVSIDTSMFTQKESTNIYEAKVVISEIQNGQPHIVAMDGMLSLFHADLAFFNPKYPDKKDFQAFFNKRADGSFYLNSIQPTSSLMYLLEYLAQEYYRLSEENGKLKMANETANNPKR